MQHAHKFSARPVFALDAAIVRGNGAEDRSAVAAGVGLRIQGLNSGAEVLYMKSVRDSFDRQDGGYNVIVRFYARPNLFFSN